MDPFRILGISQEADTKEIRLAYRHRAQAVHPDVGGDVDRFIELQQAYELATLTRAANRLRGNRQSTVSSNLQDHGSPVEPNRYLLAELAYRFELGRPGRTILSLIVAVDRELNPNSPPLVVPSDAQEHISYLLSRRASTAFVVTGIVRAIDDARAHSHDLS